ncbi:MAG: hemerythrin domain-containing protein [Desulfobacterales bacterium]|nr:hemerythrin domain-containing protein [Desulfobacterales bacterium]
MTNVSKIDNTIAKLSQEHKLIADYVAKFSKGKAEKDKTFFAQLNQFIGFLKKDLIKHFELEEHVFFPAAINGSVSYDTALVVLGFQKEHGILEKELEAILSRENEIAPGKVDAALIRDLSSFFEKLKVHAKRELIELFPLIDENSRCKALVKQYLDTEKAGP